MSVSYDRKPQPQSRLFDSNSLNLFFQPAEDISVVSWNRQVQHILASANPSGKAVVWDLRKNEPIIKISDHSNRVGERFILPNHCKNYFVL